MIFFEQNHFELYLLKKLFFLFENIFKASLRGTTSEALSSLPRLEATLRDDHAFKINAFPACRPPAHLLDHLRQFHLLLRNGRAK